MCKKVFGRSISIDIEKDGVRFSKKKKPEGATASATPVSCQGDPSNVWSLCIEGGALYLINNGQKHMVSGVQVKKYKEKGETVEKFSYAQTWDPVSPSKLYLVIENFSS